MILWVVWSLIIHKRIYILKYPDRQNYASYLSRQGILSRDVEDGKPPPLSCTLAFSLKAEDLSAAPVALAVAVAGGLPLVVPEGEEDGLVANLVLNGVDCLSLLLGASAGNAVALAGIGPASLKDETGLVADALDDGQLALDELAGVLRLGVGVEVGVGVAGDDVNGGAELRDIVVLPGGDDVGGGEGAGVHRGELRLSALNQAGELGNGAEAVK
jgi:hypothetical protein